LSATSSSSSSCRHPLPCPCVAMAMVVAAPVELLPPRQSPWLWPRRSISSIVLVDPAKLLLSLSRTPPWPRIEPTKLSLLRPSSPRCRDRHHGPASSRPSSCRRAHRAGRVLAAAPAAMAARRADRAPVAAPVEHQRALLFVLPPQITCESKHC
jgi:hypothetical protein